ncbi:MAG: efflux RND transporter periplasmic adaptor subunit [Cyanobacteria bacterium REEB67]|nr:efflux RND transporter periplasmic adaptor subunit [Cyanobacteria bacterium REEB67]
MAITEEKEQARLLDTDNKPAVGRKASGMVRLLSLSGIAMALVLPIGIYPRLLQSQELEQGHSQLENQLPAVTVAPPKASPASRQLTLPGTVEALQETPVYARADGYIKSRFADIGDRVTTGQVLADIETPEVDESAKEARALVLTQMATKAQIQANLDKAKADYDTAVADLAQARANVIERKSNQKFSESSDRRWRTLAEQGAVSSHDADDKENNLKMSIAATQAAEDRVRSLQSQVIAARARVHAELANLNMGDANIDAAQARQNRTKTQQAFNKVTAPFTGVITERNIDAGTLITGGSENSKTSLYRIARIDTVKVFVEVPQYASSSIRVGQTVQVALKEFPGRVFSGKILRTSVALDAAARTLKTEIHIPNPDLTLTPGMYADVSFALPRNTRTFIIPANALVTRGDGPQVVLAVNNTIEYRPVQLGDDFGKEIEVVAGLKGNDQVVVNPSDALKDGGRVAIDKPIEK